jgi:hypothetical protein
MFLPFAGYLLKLPFPPFSALSRARKSVFQFARSIKQHVDKLDNDGKIAPKCLSESLLQFAKCPGIVEREVVSEVFVMILAGLLHLQFNLKASIDLLACKVMRQLLTHCHGSSTL